MQLLKNINRQTCFVAETLDKLSGPEYNWAVRKLIVPGIFLIASEAIAFVGIAYYSIALLVKALPATVQQLQRDVSASSPWQSFYDDYYLTRLKCCLTLIAQAPQDALKGKDLAKQLTAATVAIFQKDTQKKPQPIVHPKVVPGPNLFDKSWSFVRKNALPLSIFTIGAFALACLSWRRASCSALQAAEFTSYGEYGFEYSLNPKCSLNPKEVERAFKDLASNSSTLSDTQKNIFTEIKNNDINSSFLKWINKVALHRYPDTCHPDQPMSLTYFVCQDPYEKIPRYLKTFLNCLRHEVTLNAKEACDRYPGSYVSQGPIGPKCFLEEYSNKYDSNDY